VRDGQGSRIFAANAFAVEPARVASQSNRAVRADDAATFWHSPDGRVTLLHDDSLEALTRLDPESVDCVFADPPYFLSNGGTTCKSGRRARVDKGDWDRSRGVEENHEFNRTWLSLCQRALKPNGTIWVSGTSHVIYSVGFAMQQLGFKMLNEIVWEKPNPPPNLSCRYFTHSTETVLWAARDHGAKHHFAYAAMRKHNGGKQMKSVWRMTAPGKAEKLHGKHPTQKPVELLDRILVASCPPESLVIDPFNGSGTTGLAAVRRGHHYVGIDRDASYLALTRARLCDEVPAWTSARLRLA
jgi:site-specific DNA-methyltransferase (adenine-specific)